MVLENLFGSNMQVKFVSPDISLPRSKDSGLDQDHIGNDNIEHESCDISTAPITNLSISSAVFKKQPPDNLRKSNFFHFDLTFYDSIGQEVVVEKGSFIGFIEELPDEKPLRNGIKYELLFCYFNNLKEKSVISVRLIDSSTKIPICYEGQDKNPDMCRVLLTHEVMCSRCCDSKSCGNRNETPSDPVIMNNGTVTRYHMKCNQNCLKNAGNPRETRRFQVLIEILGENEIRSLVSSENMFVHNNSKHGRRASTICDNFVSMSNCGEMLSKLPVIRQVIPKVGKQSGHEEVAIIGENFFEGIQIMFGDKLALKVEVLSSFLIKAITPPYNGVPVVEIKSIHGYRYLQRGISPVFRYANDNCDNHMDFYFERLWEVLPKLPSDVEKPTKEGLMIRTLGLFEQFYMTNGVFYNSYENGRGLNHNYLQNSINYQAPNSITYQSIREPKINGNSKSSVSTETPLDNSHSGNNDCLRHSNMNGVNQNGYETAPANNGGYILGPVMIGMNHCDSMPPIPINSQSLYMPYQGIYDSTQGSLKMNYPTKRHYNGVQ